MVLEIRMEFDKNIELADNAMLKHRPELFYEWDFEKNNELGLNVYKITHKSNKKAHWLCNKCSSKWNAKVYSRTSGSICPFCSGVKTNDTNCLAKAYPETVLIWHITKNEKHTPSTIHCHSGEKVWWHCLDCKSEYQSTVYHKTVRKQSCPYCTRVRANPTNSLALLEPELAKEWHPTKNGKLTPHSITSRNERKIWWLGRCGHEWDMVVRDRTVEGCGCPYCSNHRVLRGFNDMWTTSPETASILLNSEDGYKYTQSSGESVDWKCRECKTVIKNRRISSINRDGLSCPKCSDGISFGEKFVYNMLKESNIQFVFDEAQKWSQGKRYDFFLPEYNWIIEVHGLQHYTDSFSRIKGARNLVEEQHNDVLKEKLAMENDINKYTVLDARKSTLEWIESSVLKSDLINILGSVNFENIYQLSQKSNVKIACELWKSGVRSVPEIAKSIGINPATIRGYLKKGVKLGWCDYCPLEASRNSGVLAGKRSSKEIVQLNKTTAFINKWHSAAEAERSLGVHNTSISFVCRGKLKSSGGFKWMYKEDYDKMIQEGLTHEEYMKKYYPKAK